MRVHKYCGLKMSTGLTLAFLALYLSVAVSSQTMVFHLSLDPLGERETLNVSGCTNVAPEKARIVAINTLDNCVRLYSSRNCSGRMLELPDLHTSNFGFKTEYVGTCGYTCALEITGGMPTKPKELTIFKANSFNGENVTLLVQGCTLVPIPMGFVHKFAPTITNGTCFQVYNNHHCSWIEPDGDSIELRPGGQFYYGIITGRNFSEARAVSCCRFKCDSSTVQAQPSQEISDLKPNEIILYNDKNFTGNQSKAFLNQQGCAGLPDKFKIRSMKTFNLSCVNLFIDTDCREILMEIPVNVDEIPTSFSSFARSIGLCSPSPPPPPDSTGVLNMPLLFWILGGTLGVINVVLVLYCLRHWLMRTWYRCMGRIPRYKIVVEDL